MSLALVRLACVVWFKQFEPQAPHGFGTSYRGFPAFLAPSNCLLKNRQATQAIVRYEMIIANSALQAIYLPTSNARLYHGTIDKCTTKFSHMHD